jgi:MFS family permease
MPSGAKYLIYSSILPAVAFGMFYTDLPYFLTTVQHLSLAFMGAVITVMGVTTVAASIPMGIAADRYGRKKFLMAGNVIVSLIIIIFALTANQAILIAAAILEGISEGAFAASSSVLLAEQAGDAKRTSVFSLYGFVSGIAFGLGSIMIPLVAIFEIFGLSNQQSHTFLFLLLASLSLASTGFMLPVRETGKLKRLGRGIRDLLPKKSKDVLVKYVIAGSIIAFGAGMVVPLMSKWFQLQYGIPDTLSGPILGVSSLVIGLATLTSPYLAKRFGMVKAIVITQAVSNIFMFATPLSPTFISASIVYTLRSFLMNMSEPLQQSMIMGLVSEDERGAASGISSALWRLPNSLSVGIGTWLMGQGLLAAPFFLAGIFYLAAIAIFWRFFRNTTMPEEQQKRPAEGQRKQPAA